jgi:GT2 family glycosyltransferase
MFFSVIIPTLDINNLLIKCLQKLNLQTYKNFEVILISEKKFFINLKKYSFPLRIFSKKIITPGLKKNYAAKLAKGKYLSFIDDDAYPDFNWLLEASKKIKRINNNFFILGGPGILPPNSGLFSEITDLSFRSKFFGKARMRYEKIFKKNLNKNLDDWPSVNMFIKKSLFFNLGGFDKNFWPGEDSKLCNSLLKKGGKIYYEPNIFVFHYRRASLISHVKQIFRYSFTRGVFYRHGDLNSKKFVYLIPTIFCLFLIITYFLYIKVFLFILIIFFFVLLLEQVIFFKTKYFLLILATPVIILLNILVYGIGFFLSFILQNYKTKLYR